MTTLVLQLPRLILWMALCFISASVQAGTSYWRVTTDRISVVSDGSARRCERLAAQFIRVEALVAELSAWESEAELTPIAIFSVTRADARDHFLTREERANSQRQVYSKYLPHADLNMAAVVNTGSDEPVQSALLLYAQSLMMGGPGRRSPAWFQLGVSNVLNGLVIRDDGSVILNRNVVFEPIVDGEIKQVRKLDLERLLTLDHSEIDSANIRAYSSVARDWALFGLLTTPERKQAYGELALLIGQGTPASEAVPDTFGVSLAELTKQFEDRSWRSQVTYKLPPPAEPIAVPNATKLDDEQRALQLEILEYRIHQTPMRGL